MKMTKEEVFEIYEFDDAKKTIAIVGYVIEKPVKQLDLDTFHRRMIVILTRMSYYQNAQINMVFFDNGDQYVQI